MIENMPFEFVEISSEKGSYLISIYCRSYILGILVSTPYCESPWSSLKYLIEVENEWIKTMFEFNTLDVILC